MRITTFMAFPRGICAYVYLFSFWLINFLLLPAYAVDKPISFDTSAQQAILLDYHTNTILFERKASDKFAPASLVKLMTAALVFRELKEGRLKLESEMVVSTNAWRKGGAVSGAANMLLTPNKIMRVNDLLDGLIVGGANDAAITLAESIAGTEARFVQLMNDYAHSNGFMSLTFMNVTGFAHPEQTGSLRDYAQLAAHLIRDYPEYYPLFGQKEFPLGRGRQVNRNPLVALDIGVDGLMGGNLPASGYHLVASSILEGRRLIAVVAGLPSAQERALETRKLLEWGHRRYDLRKIYLAGTKVGKVMLYGGDAWAVDVRVPKDVIVPVLRGSEDNLVIRLAYEGPVLAPIAEGSRVARLQILLEGRIIQESPLEAAQNISKGGIFSRASDAIMSLSRRWVIDSFKLFFDQFAQRPPPGASQPHSRMVAP